MIDNDNIGCGVVVISNNKILLVKNKHNKWGIPKGGKEPWETIKQAAFRELEEETGLNINSASINNDSLDYIDTKKGKLWFYKIVLDEKAKIKAKNEIVEVKFYDFVEARMIIMDYQKEIINKLSLN